MPERLMRLSRRPITLCTNTSKAIRSLLSMHMHREESYYATISSVKRKVQGVSPAGRALFTSSVLDDEINHDHRIRPLARLECFFFFGSSRNSGYYVICKELPSTKTSKLVSEATTLGTGAFTLYGFVAADERIGKEGFA